MTKRWILFSLWFVAGCLPHPSSQVQKAKPELLIKGQVIPAGEDTVAPTAVFIEDMATAETVTAEDGTFAIRLDADRLELLRLQYGLQNPRLHLYFVSESAVPESAVIDAVNLQARGEMDLGNVQLQPEIQVTGRVVAYGTAVADARVRLGRQELITAADGTFAASVPAGSMTQLLVEKKGFVQTQGSWLASGQDRDIELYSDRSPVGSIHAAPILRTAANLPIVLSYSATRAAHWIRFAGTPEALYRNYEPDAPWQDLRQPLQVVAAPVIYYQFADRDQTSPGPILTYTPNIAEE